MNKVLTLLFKWTGNRIYRYFSFTSSLYSHRMRLRKKTWRSPGTVFLDHQVFERDIHVFANYEMFIEPLEGEETGVCKDMGELYGGSW